MIHRQPSIWETCSVPAAAMSKPRQHCTRQPGSILHLRRLGTISVICSTIKGVPKPPSKACARRCRSRLTTATQCSTWLCCCNEKINVQRRQITGGAISLSTASPNGLAAHADHSNSARCSDVGSSDDTTKSPTTTNADHFRPNPGSVRFWPKMPQVLSKPLDVMVEIELSLGKMPQSG